MYQHVLCIVNTIHPHLQVLERSIDDTKESTTVHNTMEHANETQAGITLLLALTMAESLTLSLYLIPNTSLYPYHYPNIDPNPNSYQYRNHDAYLTFKYLNP